MAHAKKRCTGGPGGNRTHIRGFAVRCITTLPPDRGAVSGLENRGNPPVFSAGRSSSTFIGVSLGSAGLHGFAVPGTRHWPPSRGDQPGRSRPFDACRDAPRLGMLMVCLRNAPRTRWTPTRPHQASCWFREISRNPYNLVSPTANPSPGKRRPASARKSPPWCGGSARRCGSLASRWPL